MYGLSECLKGSGTKTRVHILRYKSGMQCLVIKLMYTSCPDIGDYAKYDCSRIGPYTPSPEQGL